MAADLRTQLLRVLLESRGFVSGPSIARALGVSRATVSRIVSELINEGYVIEKHPRMGYRVVIDSDLRYLSVFGTTSSGLGGKVHYMEFCASTQDVADMLAREGAPEGTLVVCEVMSRGRGRLGREWVAGRGGLWFTLVLRPKHVGGLQLVSLAASVCVAEAIHHVYGVRAGVKWPNDVLVDERKVAGILVEGRAEAYGIGYLLVGIGVNVNNELPGYLRGYAVALRELTGNPLPRTPLLKSVLECFGKLYNRLVFGDTEYVIGRWRDLSLTLGKRVKVYLLDGVIEGVAKDVDQEGALYVETPNGLVRILAGDVVHAR